MRYLIPLPVFVCFLIGESVAGIVFQKEAITATVTACDTLEIRGVYFFVNSDTSTMSTVIYYPLPVDSVFDYPHYIMVTDLSNKRNVEYMKKKEGVTWKQVISPRSTDSVLVVYRQKTRKAKGRYILTTTRNWKRPLERADFTVIIPSDITLTYWSLQSDSVSMRNGTITYHSFQKNFFPDRDMLLEWQCEKKRKGMREHRNEEQ